jgi:hypothetical protein
LLGIVFILEISAGIAAYVLRAEVETRIDERMSQSLLKYQYDKADQSIVTDSWNVMQKEVTFPFFSLFSLWQ